MNFDINNFLKLFGSLSKLAWIIFLSGFVLIISSSDFREKFYLEEFVSNYGVWIGISTLLAGILIVINTFEKISSYFKNNNHTSQKKDKLLKMLIDLGVEEKLVLAHFLSQNRQITVFNFPYIAAIPYSIGHLQQMGFLYEMSSEYGTYYYRVSDDIWNILLSNWQEILYEEEFHRKNNQ